MKKSLLFLALGVATAFAASQALAQQTSDRADQAAIQGASAFRASEIVGMRVKDSRGNDLGKIYDLAVDPAHGNIRYAALSYDNKLFAIPWNQFKMEKNVGNAEEHWLVLNADQQKLRSMPGFNNDRWPDFPSAEWTGHQTASNQAAAGATHAILASALRGMNVYNDKNESLGEVKDLVVDIRNGTVRYAALSFGGFLGMGDKLFAVPWSDLHLVHATDNRNQRWLVLNVDKDRLRNAPGFNDNDWPKFADQQWTQHIEQFYSEQRSAERPAGTQHR